WAGPVIVRALRRLAPLRSARAGAPAADNSGILAWDEDSERRWQRYLRQRRPDVVLAHWAPNALCALGACRARGIPLVTHFHGYDASSLMRDESYRRQLRGLFERTAAVV